MTTRDTQPVKLRKSLMDQARIVGSIENRTPSDQIEYWADIGRKVSDAIGVSKTKTPYIDPKTLFAALDADRKSGKLAADIAKLSPVRYQICEDKPGLFERIDESGNVVVGRWVDGGFRPIETE